MAYSAVAVTATGLTQTADAMIQVADVTGWSLSLSGDNNFASFTFDLNADGTDDGTFSGSRLFNSSPGSTSPGFYSPGYTTFDGDYIFGDYNPGFSNPGFSNPGLMTSSGSLGVAGASLTTKFAAVNQAFPALVANLNAGVNVKDLANDGSDGVSFFATNDGNVAGSPPFAPGGNGSATGFVGIQFDISGAIHYGWLEVIVSRESGRPTGLEVLSAAYETIAGADIQTGAIPEPASVGLGLGLLALGAAGVRRSRMRS